MAFGAAVRATCIERQRPWPAQAAASIAVDMSPLWQSLADDNAVHSTRLLSPGRVSLLGQC